MKFNWGFGIALFYATFMAVLLYFVFKSTTHDNSLVVDNYYEQDLQYQSHYDRVVNTQGLDEPVKFKHNPVAQNIKITFPKSISTISGRIQMFRPSTKHRDTFLDIKVDENGSMTVPTHQLKSGRWKIKINWEADQKEYYSEEDIEL